jgi:hypothetical protein
MLYSLGSDPIEEKTTHFHRNSQQDHQYAADVEVPTQPNSTLIVRFEVFTAVTLKNDVLWDVVPCRSCVNRRFGGTYRLHRPGRKICALVPRSRNFLPWRWRRYVPLKHRFTQDLHGATSQKTAFFNTLIVAYVTVAAGTCLLSCCLAMNINPGSAILAFRHHVTIHVGSGPPDSGEG